MSNFIYFRARSEMKSSRKSRIKTQKSSLKLFYFIFFLPILMDDFISERTLNSLWDSLGSFLIHFCALPEEEKLPSLQLHAFANSFVDICISVLDENVVKFALDFGDDWKTVISET